MECYRILSPGGYLFFTYPNTFSLLSSIRKFIISIPGTKVSSNREARECRPLSIDVLKNLAQQIGYKSVEIVFLTYGNVFFLFPWSKVCNQAFEKNFGEDCDRSFPFDDFLLDVAETVESGLMPIFGKYDWKMFPT